MQEGFISSKCYQNIDLPFNKFIEVIVNDNLYALVISGQPTIEQLQDAWNNIYSEFSDVIGNNEHKFLTIVYKELAKLSITYKQITVLIELLKMFNESSIFPKHLYDELNELLHTTFEFSPDSKNKNSEYLKKCFSRSKGIKIQLDLKQAQYSALQPKEEKKEKPTKQHYKCILITLSDHAGYQLTDEISTYEFCERLKRYNKYAEQINSNKHGSR